MAVLPRIHTGGKSKFSFVSLECKTSREIMLLIIVVTTVLFLYTLAVLLDILTMEKLNIMFVRVMDVSRE